MGCQRTESAPFDADAGAPAARSSANALQALRTRFVSRTPEGVSSFLASSAARAIDREGERFVPRVDAARADVTLPARAKDAFTVASRGARIEVAIEGARDAIGDVVDGSLVYANALENAALVQVPTTVGTEEYLHFAARPSKREVRYNVTLKEGVRGLRLVGSILEFIDAEGTPVLRTTAPVVMDAKGEVREGTIDVEGCAIDRDGALPYGRTPTAPGASSCTVVTRFMDAGLEYPVLVDPAWTATTGTLASPLYEITASAFKTASGACGTGCVLVPGGVLAYGAYGAPAYSTTAQVYQESTGTFSTTTAPPFRGVGSVSLGDRVMIFGTPGTTQVAIYTYGAGTPWTTLTPVVYGGEVINDAKIAMNLDGDVYVDGRNSPTTSDYATIFKYSAGGTWSQISQPSFMVGGVGHNMQYRNGFFLGGFKAGSNTLITAGGQVVSKTTTGGITAVAERRVESTPDWVSIGALGTARMRGVSVRGADKLRWFFAGGQTTNAFSAPIPTSNAVDIWDGTSWRRATLGTARTQPLGTPFGPSGALIVGGRDGTGTWLKTAEHVAADGTILSTTTMAYAHAAVVTLQSGQALALGCPGQYASCGGTQAEIIGLLANGATCATNGDCNSAFCVDGVCCNAACTGQCQACNLPASKGTCTTVTPTNGPTGYPAGSPVTGFGTTRTICAGYAAGSVCAPKCSGASATSCSTPTTATVCKASTCAAGTEQQTAYCNGAGACPAQVPKSCGIYACGGASCLSTCTIAGPSQCAPGYTCDLASNRCISTGVAGTECTVNTDCLSGLSCVDSDKGKKVCCSVSSCAAGMFCAPSTAGDAVAGKCVKPLGSTCSARTECAAACVDGMCCDTACTGQCEACNVPGTEGTCTGVNGDPRGSREKCADGGGDVCAALACNGGEDRLKCVAYKNGPATTCSAAKCDGSTETPASTCDGKGACVAKPSRPCAPYNCNGDRCNTTCAADTDCATGNVCDKAKGECIPAKATCTEDQSGSIPPGSATAVPCAPFRCDLTSGRCYENCSASDQCAGGFVCDGSKCVAGAGSTDDGGGCAMPQSPHARGGFAFAALALALGLSRARRRSR